MSLTLEISELSMARDFQRNSKLFMITTDNLAARLFPRTDKDQFVHPKDIADAIGRRFANSRIDWGTPQTVLEAELQKLEAIGAPNPILEGHKNLFGNVLFVEISLANHPTLVIHFWAYPD